MKIKLSNLRALIENILRENPYDEEETSKQRDEDYQETLSDMDREKLISDRTNKLRKQGVQIRPRMLKAMMKDYRKLVLFLAAARDELDESDRDRAELILDLSKLYDAADDIKKGNNADALKKFKEVSKSRVTYDLLTNDKRARKDFLEIRKTIKQAVKAGPAAAEKINSENFLLGATQEEKRAIKKATEDIGTAGLEAGETIGNLQKKTKDSLSKLGGSLGGKLEDNKEEEKEKIKQIQEMLKELGFKDYEKKDLVSDGSWGARTRSAASKFLFSINQDVALYSELNLNNLEDDPLFNDLNMAKTGGEGSWKELIMKLVTFPANSEVDAFFEVLKTYKESDPMTPSKTEPKEKDPPKTAPVSSNWKDNRPDLEGTREIIKKLHKAYGDYYDDVGPQNVASDVNIDALFDSEAPGIHICFVKSMEDYKKVHGGKSFSSFLSYRQPDGKNKKWNIMNAAKKLDDEMVQYPAWEGSGPIYTDLFYNDETSELFIDSAGSDHIIPDIKIVTKDFDGKKEMFIKMDPIPVISND